jgi:NAD-dependent SIR2 family protein deacetylase
MSMDQPKLLKIVEQIKDGKIKNIIIISGAGISVNAGIPDFRSANGLYSLIGNNKDYAELSRPEDLFNILFFRKNPKPLYKFMKEFGSNKYKPTLTHQFIRLLSDKKILKTNYTQNIDGLEKLAGIPDDIVITAHGSMSNAKCIGCGKQYTFEKMMEAVNNDAILKCSKCESYVKPDIVFFGEQLPDIFHQRLNEDLNKSSPCDLLIVIGTSLTVQPVCSIPVLLPKSCPQLYINKNKTTIRDSDVELLGDCDEIVLRLSEMLGWDKDLHPVKTQTIVDLCEKMTSILKLDE